MSHNIATLADRYASLKNQIDALEAELEAVKAAIKAEGKPELVGQFAIVTLSLSERKSLDAKKAQALLTADQWASCQRVSLVETLRVKARVPV